MKLATDKSIKRALDREVKERNTLNELSYERPDPLIVASRYMDETISLISALFAYGNAHQIVKFLDTLEFDLLNESEDTIASELSRHYYRFQKPEDVIAIFVALRRLKDVDSIEDIFHKGYQREESVLDGLWSFIDTLSFIYPRDTQGYRFLIGSIPKRMSSAGTYKRYMMFLRWMVRKDNLDMGLWQKIDKKDLIIPLDTHTFKVSQKIGLLDRKTYDMKAAIQLTDKLREFDPLDPVKYDFALYRLGQERLV